MRAISTVPRLAHAALGGTIRSLATPVDTRGAAISEQTAVGKPEVRRLFPCFDGLRALAVTSVVVFHVTSNAANERVFGGSLYARLDFGVVLFFGISGFLLYRPFVLAHLAGAKMPNLRSFMTRRALRILPAYWLALTVTLFVFHKGVVANVGDFVTYYGLLQIYTKTHFFGGISQAWSLCTELSFYLALPVWAAVLRLTGWRWATTRRPRIVIELASVVVLYCCAVVFWGLRGHNPSDIALNWLPGTLDYFALGMGLAVVSAAHETAATDSRIDRLAGRLTNLWWVLAGALFLTIATQLGLSTRILAAVPSEAAIERHFLSGFVALFLIVPAVFGPQERGRIRHLLRHPVVIWVGMVSYGVYLWHLTWVKKFFDWTGQRPLRGHGLATLVLLGFVVALTAISTGASYYLVERPAIGLGRRRRQTGDVAMRRWRVVPVAGVATTTIALLVSLALVGAPQVNPPLRRLAATGRLGRQPAALLKPLGFGISGLPTGAPEAALRPESKRPAPQTWAFPEAFPRTLGTGRLARGAFYWTDFLGDDTGATSKPQKAVGPTPSGSFGYPPSVASGAADIFRAGIGLAAKETVWRVDWSQLSDPGVPIAAFGLDTDNESTTGGALWPGSAGVRTSGIDRELIVSSRGSWLLDAVTGARTAVVKLGGSFTVDKEARSFVVHLPLAALPVAARWRVWLASGLANANGTDFAPVPSIQGALPGQPSVYNVAFRTLAQESAAQGASMDTAQAAALASGDIGRFSVQLDWKQLREQTTTGEQQVTGSSDRWFVSTDLSVHPYYVYVPSSYVATSPAPVIWLLPGGLWNENEFAAVHARFLSEVCEQRNSICVSPAHPGPAGGFGALDEFEFWRVWHQVSNDYHLDPDRALIVGEEAGGLGVYELALSYPSAFAGAATLDAPPSCVAALGKDAPKTIDLCQTDGDTLALVSNARWLPFVIVQDGRQNYWLGTIAEAAGFERAGYRYRLEVLYNDAWYPEALPAVQANLTTDPRATDPATFSYRWHPALERPDLGLMPSSVYWVRALRARSSSPGTLATLDATSSGLRTPSVSVSAFKGPLVLNHVTLGIVWNQAWVVDATAGPTPPSPTSIDLNLGNIASLTVDVTKAGVLPAKSARLQVTSDGPAQVTLVGLRPGTPVVSQGPPVIADRNGQAVASVGLGLTDIGVG